MSRNTETDRLLLQLRRAAATFNSTALKLTRDLEHRSSVEVIERPKKLRAIQETVASAYHVPVLAMTSKSRTASLVLPRHVAIFLIRELTTSSLEQIAQAFNRQHSCVPHAVNSITSRVATDKQIAAKVASLREQCKGRIETLDMPLFETDGTNSARP
jgi:chromosomal replication initiation ATPase DnaA